MPCANHPRGTNNNGRRVDEPDDPGKLLTGYKYEILALIESDPVIGNN
jgi:hypothetical protein